MSAPVLVDIAASGIAVVTLNRASQHNALSPLMVVSLAATWEALAADGRVRVVVLTAAEGSSFCAGADLKLLIPLLTGARQPCTDADRAVLGDFSLFDRAILRKGDVVRKPVVCAIPHKYCLAGGFELMNGTDIRVVATHTQLGLPEVRRGLFPAGASTVRLPRNVGHAAACEIALTGLPFSAGRALSMGLVNAVVAPCDVMGKAMAFATAIAENSPAAVANIRAALRATAKVADPDEACGIEDEHAARQMVHPDAVEGPRAFAEQRPPRWSKL